MGVIRPGDEALHYSDNSHRWLCPEPDHIDPDAWADRVRAHMEAHRSFQDERARTAGGEQRQRRPPTRDPT